MNLENQQLLFSLFHDGSILNIKKDSHNYTCRVDILYLAERIHPNFSYLNVRLVGVKEFILEKLEYSEVITDIDQMNKFDIEVLQAEIEGNGIKILCSCNHGEFSYLTVKADDIQVYDPDWNAIELAQLEQTARGYWEDFAKRGEQGGRSL